MHIDLYYQTRKICSVLAEVIDAPKRIVDEWKELQRKKYSGRKTILI
jgi:hypothetical protein